MIKYHIDSPSQDIVYSNKGFIISGWALSTSKIKNINIYINDKLYKQTNVTIERLDIVNAFPEYEETLNSGFMLDMDIKDFNENSNTVTIEIVDFNGNKKLTSKEIIKTKSDMEYHQNYIENIKYNYKTLSEYTFNKVSIEIYINCSSLNGLLDTLQSLDNQSYNNVKYKLFTNSNNTNNIKRILASNKLEGILVDSINIDKNIGALPSYVGFLNAGEILEYNSIKQWVKELESTNPDLSYSDSDYYLDNGLHIKPNFKPDFSYSYLLSKNYIGGFYLIKKTENSLNIINSSIDTLLSEWRYELLLKLLIKLNSATHIQNVLWSEPFIENKSTTHNYGKHIEIVKDHLNISNQKFDAILENDGICKIKWHIDSNPKVSIIIPTTGKIDLLVPCVSSILEKTSYTNFELIFLDNGRGQHPDGIAFLRENDIKVIERNEPFNWSRLNNIGAKNSDGELLLFLNDDIEVINANWLEELVRQATRPSIGAVGSLLLYPDGRIQHAGVFLVDHGGGARHWLHFADPKKDIYQNLHKTVREVSANTGACLMIRREVFNEVNGFDENLPIVGNDIDMCLRILEKGYSNIWTPECMLIHHESVSRKEIVFTDDEKRMWERWGNTYLSGDKFYNPNLSLENSNCDLATPPKKIQNEPKVNNEKKGVNLIAYIKAEMGVGEGARGIARALSSIEIPFCIINYEKGNPSRMGDNTWENFIVNEPKYDINILHINADLTPNIVNSLPKEYFENKYTIGFWAWELPDFPDEWIPSFSYVDEVWVPSTFVKNAIEKKSSVPVYVMPHPIEKVSIPYLNRRYHKLPEESFLFLMMYDIHSIQERKNPKGAIEAFKKAFDATNTGVGLVIKVNNANDDELKQLLTEIGDYQNIYIIDKSMTRYEVDSLINSCNSFISLHKSEGFGLVLAESMAMGKAVIATNWSGNIDFMNKDNAVCIDYTLKKLGKDYGPYKAYQHWAEADIEHTVESMKKLTEDNDFAKEIGIKAKKYVAEKLSPTYIGNIMIKRIYQINESLENTSLTS